mmetsp:Transcript_190/g.518  ORF Transcript_190/g.518 Transcript_190/m.518 type:complete len:319 (-) Transcript_190:15-971(-)
MAKWPVGAHSLGGSAWGGDLAPSNSITPRGEARWFPLPWEGTRAGFTSSTERGANPAAGAVGVTAPSSTPPHASPSAWGAASAAAITWRTAATAAASAATLSTAASTAASTITRAASKPAVARSTCSRARSFASLRAAAEDSRLSSTSARTAAAICTNCWRDDASKAKRSAPAGSAAEGARRSESEKLCGVATSHTSPNDTARRSEAEELKLRRLPLHVRPRPSSARWSCAGTDAPCGSSLLTATPSERRAMPASASAERECFCGGSGERGSLRRELKRAEPENAKRGERERRVGDRPLGEATQSAGEEREWKGNAMR